MSVVGIGIDIVSVSRIRGLLAKHGARFTERCFRPGELDTAGRDGDHAFHPAGVAGRWAAKEAFLKALGTYVGDIPYRDIEVCRSSSGPVKILPHGRARTALMGSGGSRVHLSLSHERGHAVASVIIED